MAWDIAHVVEINGVAPMTTVRKVKTATDCSAATQYRGSGLSGVPIYIYIILNYDNIMTTV